MKRDLDVKPGLKIAGCVALLVAVIVIIGPYLGYMILWGYESHRINKLRVGVADFYGVVVEPDGTPIGGVSLKAKLSVYSFFGGRRDQELFATTDSNGEFSFGSRKGISLQIYDFSKDGFVVRGRQWPKDGWQYWVFRFTPHENGSYVADSKAPFVFTMEPKSGP